VKPGAGAPQPPAIAEAAGDATAFVAFAPGGRVIIARASGRIEFVDLATGQRQPIEMKLGSPRAVALSPAGDRIAVANAESADIWHVTSSSKTHLAGGDVTAILFARGGQLVTGHSGGELKIWDGPNWTNAVTLAPKVGAVAHIAQSPTTAHVAVVGAGGGVAVCDIGDHQLKQRLGAEAAWTSVAFAPDGRTIAAVGAGGIAMWDTILWQKRAAPGGKEPATDVAFWRGGTVIVTAGGDGAIRIHDLATRQLLTTLRAGGNAPVTSIDLAGDGRTIAAGNAEGVTIWDAVARSSRALAH
jgi:WD40 repeat protein